VCVLENYFPGLHNHPEQEPLLGPYVVKLAKMKMVFVGLDLHCASLTFLRMQCLYNDAGGPSFSFSEFDSDGAASSVARVVEETAMALVDETIRETCAFGCAATPVPKPPPTPTPTPTPTVTPGPDLGSPAHVRRLFEAHGFAHVTHLGSRQQGTVYSAVRVSDGAVVAVKHAALATPDARRCFDREAAALRAITHPACAAHVGAWADGGDSLIATHFESNGDLQSALARERAGAAPPEWATRKSVVAVGLALAMECVHANGFAHRDMKAANVLLNERFELVIADFGLAKSVLNDVDAGKDGPTMGIGTRLHMAPELWVDESEGYEQAVDVYAHAVLVYSMFALDPLTKFD
jgi:hypothetical protein